MSHTSIKDLVAGLIPVDRARYQDRRRAFLAEHVDIHATRGIEFGGFDLPTVPTELGSCAMADMRSEIHLATEFDIPLDEICPVDCIIEPGLAVHRQISDRFDYAILCHVLEHIPDVISMLNDLQELVVPGGVLFIALPDKRETHDLDRQSTTLARLVERHLDGAVKPSLTEIAEFALAWNEGYRQQYKDSIQDFFQTIRGQQLFGEPDVHCNVWKDVEFVEQVRELIDGGYVKGLEIIGSRPTEKPFNEFYVALRRQSARNDAAAVRSESTTRPVHYRTCNFCGFGQFEVWKRIHAPFPERLYADSPPAPDLGRELSLQYLTCRRCDLSSINPLPDFHIVDRHRFHGSNALDIGADETAKMIEDKQTTTRIQSEQHDFDAYRRTGRILDVSCGPGSTLAWLRDAGGWEVRGVEPAREFVDFARRRFGLDLFNGLVQDLPDPDGSFDVILVDSSLQCMFDPLGALLACHRLLREDGCLFLHVPNRDGIGTQRRGLNVHWGHWFFFSAGVLHRQLIELGFETQRLLGIQNPIDTALEEIIAQDPDVTRESLQVALTDPSAVNRHFEEKRNLHADFFGISARKLREPERADGTGTSFARLREISQVSHRHRTCVAVDPATNVRWPWDPAPPGPDER